VPPAFSPAAIPAPFANFKITDSQFEELESAGGIKLSHDHRDELLTLAHAWISDLQLRSSARPNDFRKCLDGMAKALLKAEEACQWDHGIKYHLVHYADDDLGGGPFVFSEALSSLEHQSKSLRETINVLRTRLS
jgi:hypothetical protein